jgi:predicted anti-sigma-YlaC factor YlaD
MRLKNLIFFAFLTFFLQSCSVSRLAVKKAGETLSNQNNTVFTGEDDPELVRDALPFTMKFYETILEKDSTNAELHLATGKLFCLYAQAFILLPSDTLPDTMADQKKAMKKRAKKLLLRGRDYCLRGIELRHPGFTALLKGKTADSALALTSQADTSFLYWCSASWMAAIISDRSDLALGMTIKKAASLMLRVAELNDQYDYGAAHEILCAYKSSIPKSMGGSDEEAREHFNKALAFSSGEKVSPFVTLATSLSVKSKNRAEFTEMLQKALSVNIQKRPSLKLQNTIYQQRAKWLMANTDRYFPPIDSTLPSKEESLSRED